MSGFYHQSERDYAMGYGCLVLMVSFVLIVIVAVVLATS